MEPPEGPKPLKKIRMPSPLPASDFDAEGNIKHWICPRCGLIHHGPHAGKRIPKVSEPYTSERNDIGHASDERTYTIAEAQDAELYYNLSDRMCGQECFDRQAEHYRRNRTPEELRRAQEIAEEAERRLQENIARRRENGGSSSGGGVAG